MDLAVVSADQPARIADLLVATGLAATVAAAKRLIAQRAVSVDGVLIDEPDAAVDPRDNWLDIRCGLRRRVTVYLAASGPGAGP